MNKRRIMLLLISITSSKIYADNSCLSKNKPLFDNKEVNIVYDSTKPNNLLIGSATQDPESMCVTSYKELTTYATQNYRKTNSTESNILVSWNYLAVNKQMVYDFLKDLNPTKLKKNNDDILSYGDFKSYTVSNQANYTPISVINNNYACYYHNWFLMATGTAHPSSGTQLVCVLINKPDTSLKISQIARESDIVQGILNSTYVKDTFTKLKIKTTNIKTYTSLSNALRNSNDDELNCLSDNINKDNDGFAINSLNTDGTINLTLGLTSDVHVCSGIFKEVQINNLKPIMKINNVTTLK